MISIKLPQVVATKYKVFCWLSSVESGLVMAQAQILGLEGRLEGVGLKDNGLEGVGLEGIGESSNLRARAQRLFLNGSGSMARAGWLEVLGSKTSGLKAHTLRLQA